ncbi:MAG: SOS response-associated peptidase [Chloroflexota bacterium]
MCGRYKLTATWAEIHRLYNLTNSLNLQPRYNIGPTQIVPAVVFDADTKERRAEMFRWGLIPSWAKNAKVDYNLINAKAETVTTKPAYREAVRKRRCIVLADGYYEWQKLPDKHKQPYAMVMKDRSVFGFAGLWEKWTDKASGEVVRSCTIIITEPNALCAPIHNRMPVILDPGDYAKWLGEQPASNNELRAMLKPFPVEQMECFKIGTKVGDVKYDEPSLVEPV